MLNVLFIDNFDSFSFNLVDELARRGCQVAVWRNDLEPDRALALALALEPPRLVVISPGPGAPQDAGCCEELVRLCAGRVPLFGVCLGLQAMVRALGGDVGPAPDIVHGKSSMVEHDGRGLFEGLPAPMMAGRYHSLAAVSVPGEMEVTARCGEVVMAVSHRDHPLDGVQFHPESILTPRGGLFIDAVIRKAMQAGGAS